MVVQTVDNLLEVKSAKILNHWFQSMSDTINACKWWEMKTLSVLSGVQLPRN